MESSFITALNFKNSWIFFESVQVVLDEEHPIQNQPRLKVFFCNRESVSILEKSFKVPDWNVREALLGTLRLSEETRLESLFKMFHLGGTYAVIAIEISVIICSVSLF